VPLSLLTVDQSGKSIVKSAIMEEREKTVAIDTKKPFKLNGGTVGVCKFRLPRGLMHTLYLISAIDRVLYTPERLTNIAMEAVKTNSCFSLNDRIGLVHDAMALSKAGLSKLSSALTLVDIFRNEKECQKTLLCECFFVCQLTLRSGLVWYLRKCLRPGFHLVGAS
jgi:aminopeptidase 2